MSISEAERHEIYELIKQHTNERIANNAMSMVPPVGWADVATATDLGALRTGLRGEMSELRGEMSELRGEMRELRGEMSELRGEMSELRGEIARLDGRIDAMRSDLLTEIHRSIRNQTWALVAWTTGLAGLVAALGR